MLRLAALLMQLPNNPAPVVKALPAQYRSPHGDLASLLQVPSPSLVCGDHLIIFSLVTFTLSLLSTSKSLYLLRIDVVAHLILSSLP